MKSCVLFSGGWDSAAAYYKTKHLKPDLLFVNYGQNYYLQELQAASDFADHEHIILKLSVMPLSHDISRRNYYLIMEAKRRGYNHIITGNRNLIPLFDRYKDSNWFNLKLLSYLLDVKIEMPILMHKKRSIVEIVKKNYPFKLYNCYDKGLVDCQCVNCIEMRNIL